MMKYILSLSLILMATGLTHTQSFNENIAPIIYKHCGGCHRPGEIGPFTLTNYQEVSNWGGTIKYVTESRYMPPWKPDPSYRNFQHENILTNDEIAQIGKWVDNGMPEGDPSKFYPFPNYPSGSQIGTPDLVVSFAKKYIHKGNGKDEYRYFVLPTNLTEDKDLVALEMRPGNTKVVHHTLFWADPTGAARAEDAKSPEYGYTGGGSSALSGEQLPGYVPGQKPNQFTAGMAQKVPKGSDLVLQMHYAPTSVDEADSSVVNLFFAKKPATRYVYNKILLPTDLINGPFIIPANQVKEFHAVYKIPLKVSLTGIWPHCHMLGQKWEAYAKLPDGTKIPLVKINEWDFNWQGGYYFNKLIVLPVNTEIHAFCTYDNTVNNPVNPNNPPKPITWGEGTSDEMFYLPISYVIALPGDENVLLGSADPKADNIVYEDATIYPIIPNPVKDEIKIGFVLSHDAVISMSVYDERGNKIQDLIQSSSYPQGQHVVKSKISNIPNGVYIVRLATNNKFVSQRFVVAN
jgi:hypothetical protein